MHDPAVVQALLSPDGRAAVASGDPGQVVKLARLALGWKQDELARRSGYSQPTISRLERGVGRAGRDVAILTDLADTLGLPPETLGLVRGDRTPPSLDGVDLREFLGGTVALAAAALLPQPVAAPGRIGASDVEQCRTSLNRLIKLDDHQGGGTVYEMAARMAGHLQEAVRSGNYTATVGHDLSEVTAATMEHAGWLAFDADRADDARRWWLETCHLTEIAALPEVRATAFASMSLHAGRYAGRGSEAAALAQAARTAMGSHATPTLLSVLAAREAVGLAQAQDPAGADAAVAQARRWLDRGRDGNEPVTLDFWNAADLASHETRVSLALGRAKPAETSARAALADADRALFPRNHAAYEARLASVLTHVGELDEAISVSSSVVQKIELLRGSRRIHAELRRTVDQLGRQTYPPARDFATAARHLLTAA